MARPTKFEINDARAGAALTVSITGELDMSTVQPLSEHINKHLSDGVTDLTLDLGDMVFMDSTGLRLLIELNNKAAGQSWRLKLKPPQDESAALVLRATGADVNLPFVPGADG